jgi:hypothetical protein
MRGQSQGKRRRGRGAIATALLLICLGLAAQAALGAEVTRPEYVESAEPICKANTEANARIFKGAKEQVKEGKLKAASAHFFRARQALAKTVNQLSALPQPTADEAKLSKWISYLGIERDFLGKIGTALRHEDKPGAQELSVRLNRNSNLANNTVLAFGFRWCRIDPGRFSAK